jgi:dihydrolipoamide dehydrogenase
MSQQVDIAIIGAGTAGLNAFSQARKVTANLVLINEGPHGTTCARVGCMPSKVLIEVAREFNRKTHFPKFGIQGSEHLTIDRVQVMKHLRELRDWFVARVMNSVDRIGDKNIQGRAHFIEPNVLEVNGERIHAKKIIIATGSRPVVPAAWHDLGSQLITTDEFFELENLPDSIAVIGLGAIGSEIGQALARLSLQVIGVEMTTAICGISDPEINKVAIEELSKDMELWLGTAAQLSATADGKIEVTTTDGRCKTVDKVLAALGRRPNFDNLGLEIFGLDFSKGFQGLINPNTMQLADFPVFIAGDVSSYRPLLHEATDEGIIAGYNAVHDPITAFQRRVPLRIAFTDPQVVIVGASFSELAGQDIAIGERNFTVQGRTKIMARTHGHLRIYAEKSTGRLLGAEMIVPDGEYIGHFLALALEQAMTLQDIMTIPYYHPTIMEGLDNAITAAAAQLENKITGPVLRQLS